MSKARDYYAEIDKALKSHEEFRQWNEKPMSWITNRIDWCWKFRKITREQMESLCARAILVFESEVM